MADVQDEDQWLYGDEKDESKEEGQISDKPDDDPDKSITEVTEENGGEKETPMEEGEKEKDGEEKEGEKEGDKEADKEDKGDDDKDDDDDSSDDDDLTVTIGAIKTQPDIIQTTAPHAGRFQPKAAPTTGLKDEDFTTPGKVNGVPVPELNVDDLEDKPWRKPGADISDYFNYGFNEESWFKYCERQKAMRISESGAGLGGLGINVTKPFFHSSNSIPVAIVNDNSKYGGAGSQRPKAGPPPRNKGMGHIDVIGGAGPKTSTIQVMTADRREYSNKVMMNGPPPSPNAYRSQPGYNDMEFGGNPYGDNYYGGDGGNFYGGGAYDTPPPWGAGGQPPMGGQGNWDGPGAPPPGVMPVSGTPGYYDDDSMGAPPPAPEPEEDRHRSRRSHRSRSRSPSRHRHSSRHARSRSRSPSHRHKRKKSKRERDAD